MNSLLSFRSLTRQFYHKNKSYLKSNSTLNSLQKSKISNSANENSILQSRSSFPRSSSKPTIKILDRETTRKEIVIFPLRKTQISFYSTEKQTPSTPQPSSSSSSSHKTHENTTVPDVEVERPMRTPGFFFCFFSFLLGVGVAISIQDSPQEEWQRWMAEVKPPPDVEVAAAEEPDPEEDLRILQIEENLHVNWLAIKFILRSFQLWILATPLILTCPVLLLKDTIVEKMWWGSLLWLLELAGPCWIKLGQWISTRPDLFSKEFCEYISRLHSNCPTHSFSQTKAIIESTFQKPLAEIFQYFDPKPLASGAIAQVHLATLINGQRVAVKVRHPNTRESVLTDLSIMSVVVRLLNQLPGVEFLSLNDAKEQFRLNMLGQLNLAREAQNLVIFRRNFKSMKEIVFPKPYVNLTSPSILVESYENGLPIADFFDSPDAPLKRKLADIGLNGYLKMMLVDRFIHADLHPGNVLVKNADPNKMNDISKGKVQLVLLDAGLVTEMTKEDNLKFISLFRAVVQGDGPGGAELMVRYAREQPKWKTPQSRDEYLKEMGSHFVEIRSKKLSEIEVGQFLASLMGTVRKYGVKLEGNFSTLMLGTIVLEGLGRRLNPDINLIESSIPFIFKEGIWADGFWEGVKHFFFGYNK